MARVIVLGGYGVFGAKLARRLVEDGHAEVMVAGRSLEKARKHCESFGGAPLALDRDGDIAGIFATLRPDVIVDCAGPFQEVAGDLSRGGSSNGEAQDRYRLARAAIACRAHYIDIADDAGFVAGIAELDSQARDAGVCVISGASSVPAISAAALDELTKDMTRVASVSATILPGNRAPRGVSVMRSILSQAGQALKVWRGGQWSRERSWGDLNAVTAHVSGAAPLERRLASRIGAPDLVLFPTRYGARSVEFRAGLELRVMHVGLWALAWLVRLRLLANLAGLTSLLHRVAQWLERFGGDRGAMVVSASGIGANGRFVTRTWQLVAEGGDGPEIPATPALLVCRKLLAAASGEGQGSRVWQEAPPHSAGKRGPETPRFPLLHSGEKVAAKQPDEGADVHARLPWRDGELSPGARPALDVLTLAEVEAGLAPFAIKCAITQDDSAPLLLDAVAPHAMALPQAWRRLAEIGDCDCFAGQASVSRGGNLLARLAGFLFGFPPASERVAVQVTKQRTENGERWTRRFDGKPFVSHLSRRAYDPPGLLCERFGPFTFQIDLRVRDQHVEWPVVGWRAFGVPLPLSLAPRSETVEFVDDDGRFRFDVAISLPFAGLVVRYRGWLEPLDMQGGG